MGPPMKKCIKRFVDSENGAVTVDWVVITAMAISISIWGLMVLRDNTTAVSDATGEALSAYNDSLNW